jgi:hypothetical protein
MKVITIGIDMAAQPKNTGICVLEWRANSVQITNLNGSATDEEIKQLIRNNSANKVGVDIPLGWPVEFTAAISAYGIGQKWPKPVGTNLRLRKTDVYVQEQTGRQPLSVAADRIAIPAMRCAHILSSLDLHRSRTGDGTLVEVYPAASLLSWGFKKEIRGYKDKKNVATRNALLNIMLVRLGPEGHSYARLLSSAGFCPQRLRCFCVCAFG